MNEKLWNRVCGALGALTGKPLPPEMLKQSGNARERSAQRMKALSGFLAENKIKVNVEKLSAEKVADKLDELAIAKMQKDTPTEGK